MGLKSTSSAWIWNRNLKKNRSSPKCLSRARFRHPLYVFGDWHSNITSVRFGGQIEKTKNCLCAGYILPNILANVTFSFTRNRGIPLSCSGRVCRNWTYCLRNVASNWWHKNEWQNMLGKIGEVYSSWREKLQENRCNNATQSWVNELLWNDVHKTLKRKVLLQT